jgi:hypothetical protein
LRGAELMTFREFRNILHDNLTFYCINIEISNEYVRLFDEAHERFSHGLKIHDEEVKRFSDMLRYSKDNGKTFREVDCLIGNIDDVEKDKLFSSSDLGRTFIKNDSTTAHYIAKIKEALSKRENYIKSHTTAELVYAISYDFDKKCLYSAENFPFIDRWSKDRIEQIRRFGRNKKFQIIKNGFIFIWGTIGTCASIISLILYFVGKN